MSNEVVRRIDLLLGPGALSAGDDAPGPSPPRRSVHLTVLAGFPTAPLIASPTALPAQIEHLIPRFRGKIGGPHGTPK